MRNAILACVHSAARSEMTAVLFNAADPKGQPLGFVRSMGDDLNLRVAAMTSAQAWGADA